MRKARYTETKREQIVARILEILARGPASTATLAAHFEYSPHQLSWIVGQMVKTHQIKLFCHKRDCRIWCTLNSTAPMDSLTEMADKTEWNGIDEEHKQWMTYWRTPKAARRRMQMEGV